MTKTRNLSDLLDATGDVKSGALDNVPASNDASALTTGTLPSARLGTVTGFTSTGIDDNATSTAITIHSSNRIGIGTLSPNSGTKIHVQDTSANLPKIRIDTSDGGNKRLDLAVDSSGAYIEARQSAQSININANTNLIFKTGSSGGSERMRIDSSGRVAIGSSTASGAKLYVPADGQTTDAWVRHGSTAYASGSWGGGADVRVSWDIVHSVSYVLEFLTASYGARQQFIVGSYYAGSQHQTIIANNGNTGTMTQGDHPTAQESWRNSAGTHGVYCVRITSANGLQNALVEIL